MSYAASCWSVTTRKYIAKNIYTMQTLAILLHFELELPGINYKYPIKQLSVKYINSL
jgi:hypothetical protein